jgi:NADH-quinone oxidoreductase subunit N
VISLAPVQGLAVLAAGPLPAETSFTAPTIDYAAVLPMLLVFGAALVGVLVEAFAPRAQRFVAQVWLTLLTLVAALLDVAYLAHNDVNVVTAGVVRSGGTAVAGSVVIDRPSLFLQGTILALAVLAVLTMSERQVDEGGPFTSQASAVPGSAAEGAARRAGMLQSEVFPLVLFSVGGMMLFPASDDLLTMFVALEVFSLPLYLLCGLARRRRLLSQEASLKYFLLGAFSSAFFLYGAAMLYGFSGSVRLSDIAAAITGSGGGAVINRDGLLLLGVAMVSVGLLFKVSAAPFHVWTPDVYQGAPTPVTGFMAACTKVAAFGALLRVAYVAVPGARWDFSPALWVVAVLTMLVGSVIAIVQTDVKRMLAYSSIAHAGFLLVGVLSMDKAGVSGVLFYLAAYGFTTIGAFALITVVRDSSAEGVIGGEATHLAQWAGLGKRHPLTAGVFTLFLLAFAGIPLTSGFVGKFAVFSAAVAQGGWVLALIGVLASAVAAFFYVRVIVLMYFSEPTGGPTTVAMPGAGTLFSIVMAAAVTIMLGVYPSLLLSPAIGSAVFLP